MDQDLMEWITAEKEIGGTGLLLVPEVVGAEKIQAIAPSLEEFILSVRDEDDVEDKAEEPEPNVESESEIKPEELEEFSNKISELNQSVQELEKIFNVDSESQEISSDNENENESENDNDESEIEDPEASREESQENFSKLDINLNEPPPELWTRINPEDNYSENDDEEELDYEQGMSLQGAAYVPKEPKESPGRLRNFTERLHQSLRSRKQKAEQLREQEEKKSQHSYRSRAFMICATLLVTLGLAYLALYFVQRWTPGKIYERAQTRLEIGDYEAAMKLFNRGYKRYPENLNFLKGFAKAAESADMTRTAIAAWEDYIKLLPEDEGENKNFAILELKRIKGEKRD